MSGSPGAAAPVPARPDGTSLVWLRDDLRLGDNPAVTAAVERGRPLTLVYVLDEVSRGIRPLGGAARWWLHQSLTSLAAGTAALGGRLLLRRGDAATVIGELVDELGAGAVFWNRRYGAAERDVDTRIKASLTDAGIVAHSLSGSLLFEPWTIRTGGGTPYTVFTPFWRACTAGPPPRAPYPTPATLDLPGDASASGGADPARTAPAALPSDDLASWELEPRRPDWADGLREAWTPGEDAAQQLLAAFLDDALPQYGTERDLPAQQATSRLSPYLRWGEISPHQIWHATDVARRGLTGAAATSATRFLTEVGWREFAYHVLFHAPDLATANLRPGFDAFPWPPLDDTALTAWQQGRTGFRLVDAGMRELWRTGSMHNRVRMVTASFLIKNLLIDWRLGEQWFWDTLVDADPASNPFGWQWVAGSGADAAPYFRVFNPELQAAKFDPDNEYVRQNVPEWGTAAYPQPIVDLGETRRAALAAYEQVKTSRTVS